MLKLHKLQRRKNTYAVNILKIRRKDSPKFDVSFKEEKETNENDSIHVGTACFAVFAAA